MSNRVKRVVPKTNENVIMTLNEVADYLRVSDETIYRMASNREIPSFRLGKRGNWRFIKANIEQWIVDQSSIGMK
jgi:excisionase family DNA binding protein